MRRGARDREWRLGNRELAIGNRELGIGMRIKLVEGSIPCKIIAGGLGLCDEPLI